MWSRKKKEKGKKKKDKGQKGDGVLRAGFQLD
jgi:hypothetical protein